jgi:hypothetical protein
MNAINVISPYKHHGMWVFDDARVGLTQEPFVSGADTWIDRVVADIPNAENGFTLIFSSTPFPGHQYRLDWRRAEGGGNWYFYEACRAISSKRPGAAAESQQNRAPTASTRAHGSPLIRRYSQ